MKELEKILESDKKYQMYLKDFGEIQKKYYGLQISTEDRIIIEDYMACMRRMMDLKCEYAYKLGVIRAKRNY